jgi:chromatin modification-related protein VID21
MQIGDYGSDDGSEDDQEKDQGDVVDPPNTNSLMQEALAQSDCIELKVKDADDFPPSFDLQQPDSQEQRADPGSGQSSSRQDSQENDPLPSGLKSTSQNPVLYSAVHRAVFAAATIYLREKLAYSDTSKLFLDFDDLEAERSVDEPSTFLEVVNSLPSFPDLSVLFLDLQSYGLLDVIPATIQLDGKKNRRERDDLNKRAEDTTYSKLTLVSKFMHCRPTLVGPLQPSKHWKENKWHNLDGLLIYPSRLAGADPFLGCGLFVLLSGKLYDFLVYISEMASMGEVASFGANIQEAY